jgi:hypothetical protein
MEAMYIKLAAVCKGFFRQNVEKRSEQIFADGILAGVSPLTNHCSLA